MVSGFRQVIAKEGAGALLTGLGPTVAGYSVQGALKFGGYEFWKKVAIDTVGIDSARENRTAIYLGASAIAEFFADIALCPLEATRIRLVSQPSFASGLFPGFARIAREEGVAGFYAGWVASSSPTITRLFARLTFLLDFADSDPSSSSRSLTPWQSSPSSRSPRRRSSPLPERPRSSSSVRS
jgi:solute carrier family 25 phosphate transporter 3